MTKKEELHIEKSIGNFMIATCNKLETLWRQDEGQQLLKLAYGNKKFKDQQIEPINIILESVIKFYQQKMVDWLETNGGVNIKEIPKKFTYITGRDSVEQRIFNYFIDLDEKGKAIKKDPLYNNIKIYNHTLTLEEFDQVSKEKH